MRKVLVDPLPIGSTLVSKERRYRWGTLKSTYKTEQATEFGDRYSPSTEERKAKDQPGGTKFVEA